MNWDGLTLKQWREQMKVLLVLNNVALERAIVLIHDRQTEIEKQSCNTIERNKVGFTAFDAEIFSSFAEQILRGRRLTPKQLETARRAMPKYWRQLREIALEKDRQIRMEL